MSIVTTEQLLFLDNLIYLNYPSELVSTDIGIETTLLDLVNYALNNMNSCAAGDPAAMTPQQWIDLLTAFKNNPDNAEFLKNYKVTNYNI